MRRFSLVLLLSLFLVGLLSVPFLPHESTIDQVTIDNQTELPDPSPLGTAKQVEEFIPWTPFLPDLNDTDYYRQYDLAGEGDTSPDSMTGFTETTDDNVLSYPDAFYNDTIDYADSSSGETSGSVSDTQVIDGTAITCSGNQEESDIALIWDLPSCKIEGFSVAVYWKYSTTGTIDSHQAKAYHESTGWTIYDAAGDTSYTWSNLTTYDPDYWDTTPFPDQIAIQVEAHEIPAPATLASYIDYAEITYYVMHLGDSDHYTESFAGVSDWTFGYAANQAGGDYSFTTDNDVGAVKVTFDQAAGVGEYVRYDMNITSFGFTYESDAYIEFRYKVDNAACAGRVRLYDTSEHSTTAAENLIATTWTTIKIHLSSYAAGAAAITAIHIYADDLDNDDASGIHYFYLDYMRIGPSDEMGMQHDMSTLEPISASGGLIDGSSTDGDKINFTNNAGSAAAEYSNIFYDSTTTNAAGSFTYYQFLEISISAIGDGNSDGNVWLLRLYDSDGTYQNLIGYVDDVGIFRFNLVAITPIDLEYLRLYVHRPDDWVQVDYFQLYSIADYSYLQGASVSTNDFFYTSSGVLYCENDAADYMGLLLDPAISVAAATYNIWNISTSSGLGNEFSFRLDNGGWTSYNDEETRGTMPSGTSVDMAFYVYNDVDISAIEFWEDAVDPVIDEKYSNPRDPSLRDNVTIETVIIDVVGAYTVTATPLSEPSGSNLGTISLSLEAISTSGNELWSYTFDSGDLQEGRYLFEIDAFDGANHDYAFLSFTVSEDLRFTRIRIRSNLLGVESSIPFNSFDVYLNDTILLDDLFEADSSKKHKITVKDRWGQTLNETVFDWASDLVVNVDVHSLKVVSWTESYALFNITRAGTTFSEVLMPGGTQVLEYLLFNGTYSYAVDYLNGSSLSSSIDLTNSTAIVVTGNSISDLAGLSSLILSMTTTINVTVTQTNNQVVTITLDLTNVNSTIYNQTISILTNVENINSTIADQTTTLLSTISNVNSTLYAQTVSILADISNMNSTLYTQTVNLLSSIQNVNTTLYSQTLSIISNIQNVNSTLYSQAVSMLLTIYNVNSTLYSQTVSIIAEINNIEQQILILEETVDDLDIHPQIFVPTPIATIPEPVVSSIVARGREPTLEIVIALVGLVCAAVILGGIIIWRDQQNQANVDSRRTVSQPPKKNNTDAIG